MPTSGTASSTACSLEEIESVIRNAGRGFPRKSGNGKYLVIGRGRGGRMVRVIFLSDPAPVIYPIHAMPVTTRRRRG